MLAMEAERFVLIELLEVAVEESVTESSFSPPAPSSNFWTSFQVNFLWDPFWFLWSSCLSINCSNRCSLCMCFCFCLSLKAFTKDSILLWMPIVIDCSSPILGVGGLILILIEPSLGLILLTRSSSPSLSLPSSLLLSSPSAPSFEEGPLRFGFKSIENELFLLSLSMSSSSSTPSSSFFSSSARQ